MKVTVNVDGGARGNPGPAAIGVVVADVGGEVIDRRAVRIGEATNNVAEYRAMIAGIEAGLEAGATELELLGDSLLIVKQILGDYKVKDAGLKPLHAEARRALEGVPKWSIRHVRRELNAEADRLVNAALDAA